MNNRLALLNPRTSKIEDFKAILRIRHNREYRNEIHAVYRGKHHNVARWLKKRARRSEEDRFVHKMKQRCGEGAVFGVGHWQGGAGLRRRLAQKVTVVTVAEFYTTKTCCK